MIIVILITILVLCFSIASFIANCGYDDKKKKRMEKRKKRVWKNIEK